MFFPVFICKHKQVSRMFTVACYIHALNLQYIYIYISYCRVSTVAALHVALPDLGK